MIQQVNKPEILHSLTFYTQQCESEQFLLHLPVASMKGTSYFARNRNCLVWMNPKPPA